MNEPTPYILLIDDDGDDLELFSSELRKKGIGVRTFELSEEALFYLKLMSGNRELPLLIIMDYNMPKRDGLEVLLLLKSNADTKDIPVVIYSTHISGLLRTQLSDAGSLDCFIKPWDFEDVKAQIDIFLNIAYSFLKQ